MPLFSEGTPKLYIIIEKSLQAVVNSKKPKRLVMIEESITFSWEAIEGLIWEYLYSKVPTHSVCKGYGATYCNDLVKVKFTRDDKGMKVSCDLVWDQLK